MTTELETGKAPVGLSGEDAKKLRAACDADPFLFLRVVCGYDRLVHTFHAPLVYMLSGRVDILSAMFQNEAFMKKSFTAREIQSVLKNRHGVHDISGFAGAKRAGELFDFVNLRQYRGSGKSSIGHGIDAYDLAVNPQNTILICSAAEDRAVSFSRQVRMIYEGEVFKALYPDRYAGSNLTDRRITLAGRRPISPQAGIEAWGYTSSIVGAHFNIFSIDDLTIDSNVFDVTTGIPAFLAGLGGLYEPRRIRRRHFGTVWDELDDHYILSQVSTCFSLVIPVEDFGGDPPEDIRMRGIPTNPDWHPTEAIEALQQEILASNEGAPSWRRNFMLDPTAGGGRMFTRRMLDQATWFEAEKKEDNGRVIKYCVTYARDGIGRQILNEEGEPKLDFCDMRSLSVYIGCDQSVSDEGDEWGVAVLGISPNGRGYILETRRGHGYERMLNFVVISADKWKPSRIGLEKGGMQDSTLYWMNIDPKFASIRGLLEGVPTGNERKESRISNSVAEPMRINRLYVKHGDQDCIDEMLKYKPSDKADDGLLDAISIAATLAKAPAKSAELAAAISRKKKRSFSNRDPITGIFRGFRILR